MTSCTMCAKDFPKEYKYCPLCGVPFANESDPHYWGRKALTSRLSGEDLSTSIEAIKKACQLSPDNAHLLSGLGNLYYRAGELAAKSAMVKSVSWPMAETTGRGEATMARATRSLLKAARSSSEPPPRARTMTSTRPAAFS